MFIPRCYIHLRWRFSFFLYISNSIQLSSSCIATGWQSVATYNSLVPGRGGPSLIDRSSTVKWRVEPPGITCNTKCMPVEIKFLMLVKINSQMFGQIEIPNACSENEVPNIHGQNESKSERSYIWYASLSICHLRGN